MQKNMVISFVLPKTFCNFVPKFCTAPFVAGMHNNNHINILTGYESIEIRRYISRFRQEYSECKKHC